MNVTLSIQEYHELMAGQKKRLEEYHNALSLAVIEALRRNEYSARLGGFDSLRVDLSKAINACHLKYLNPEGLPVA
jgi:hypothetical protein